MARRTAVMRGALSVLVAGFVVSSMVIPAAATAQRGYVPTSSLRIMDTRIDDGGPMFGAEERRTVHLAARAPLGAKAVELNITAIDASEPTHLAVWPAGKARPYTANLLIGPGEVRSNTVLVGLGDLFAITLYNDAGAVNVIVDVIGWFTGDFAGMRPMRMVDTRFGYGAQRVQAGTDQDIVIGGRFGVPGDATAVSMNVSAVGASEPTSLVMWPTGTDKPLIGMVPVPTSGLHGQSAIVGLEYGSFSMSTTVGSVDVIVDVTGWFRADGLFVAKPPQRVVDTKIGTCGVALGPGETRTFPVTDAADVFAVAVNLGAVEASENTFLTVWGAGGPQPSASNLNVMAGSGATGAVVITELGVGGQISVFNAAGTVHVTVDVIGTFSGTTPSGDRTPCPMPEPEPATAPSTTKPPVSWQTTMINAINRERSTAGLSPVSSCGALSQTAQAYADVLIGTRDINHIGPDGSNLQARVANAGYVGWTNIGENLAAGQGTVDEVMSAWMGSPGHRANILKPEFTHVGFGRAKGLYKDNTVESWFWVQNFGAGGIC